MHASAEELTHARHAPGSMNTATMTFVLFFEDAGVASWVRERTRAVADKHPSRVIIFDGTRTEGEQYAAPSLIRGEWVEIGVKGSNEHELASALATLVLPEAPVVLAWIAPKISRDDRFVRLAKMASTVIVSSSVINTNESALQDLTEFVDKHPEIIVQDISYLRLAVWQELVAEFFDESEYLDELLALREVELTAGSRAEMYYLLGWLASRLAWTPCDVDRFCNTRNEIIRFTMHNGGQPRRLSRVILRSATVEFLAEVCPVDEGAVCLRVSGSKQRDERWAPLHTMDIASLVERAILTRGHDDIFIETLAMAKHIMERRGL